MWYNDNGEVVSQGYELNVEIEQTSEFTIEVCDGYECDVDSVLLTMLPEENDAPVAIDDTAITTINTAKNNIGINFDIIHLSTRGIFLNMPYIW